MITDPSEFFTQSGEVSDPQDKTTDAVTNCDPVPAASLVVTMIDWLTSCNPEVVSGLATGAGGGVTYGVIVAFTTRPSPSAT
jgi:hypothetical protein